jgi:hypothetical protein
MAENPGGGAAHMAIHDQSWAAIDWPLPPFFQFAESPPPTKECAMELIDGLVIRGELVEFDLNADSVAVRVPDSESLQWMKFALIRTIKMLAPIAYIADAAALDSLGATVWHADNQRAFVVALRDGTKIKGTTLGFIKETAGVFLYAVEGETVLAINYFIPASRIEDLQIGPLLGETLVGFSELDLGLLKKMISRTFGLFLVCGPTGSGKTTTLHSLLREINRPDLKIWTAEDPIEITQPGLRQVQVHSKIDWTFAAAMRAFLRADPDVIMVGEMRDAETTKIGIEASLTGHLVL